MENLIPIPDSKFIPNKEWKKLNLVNPKKPLDAIQALRLQKILEDANSMVFLEKNKHYVMFAQRIGYYLTEIPRKN